MLHTTYKITLTLLFKFQISTKICCSSSLLGVLKIGMIDSLWESSLEDNFEFIEDICLVKVHCQVVRMACIGIGKEDGMHWNR